MPKKDRKESKSVIKRSNDEAKTNWKKKKAKKKGVGKNKETFACSPLGYKRGEMFNLSWFLPEKRSGLGGKTKGTGVSRQTLGPSQRAALGGVNKGPTRHPKREKKSADKVRSDCINQQDKPGKGGFESPTVTKPDAKGKGRGELELRVATLRRVRLSRKKLFPPRKRKKGPTGLY